MKDIIVVGAGIVGSLIARELSKYHLNVLIIDKENDVGNVTTMANSAIVHSGYDPEPNSLKAKLNVLGNKMFKQLCQDLDVNYGQIGSLTIALSDEQVLILHDLAKRAKENGVNVQLLSAEEIIKIEPNINPNLKMGLLAPTCGIVDPFNLCAHAMECACDNGVELHLNEEVLNIVNCNSYFEIKTNHQTYQSKIVIDAAGLNSDKILNFIEPCDWKITPRKGEYYVLDHYAPGLVNHVIFPIPTNKGKGILITLTTSGNYLVGPSSEFIDDNEDFSTDSLTLANVKKSALEMIPNIPFQHVIRCFSGLRATSTRHDFVIESAKSSKNFIVVGGIESPGLASSPAIAKYVVEEFVSKLINLTPKDDFNPKIKPYINLKSLSNEKRNELIKQNPEYGTIICGCEKISLGEIKDLFKRSVPPYTVKAIKKRIRAGFGKCQGGFCHPSIVSILAKEYHISPLDVLYDKNHSNILVCRLKDGK